MRSFTDSLRKELIATRIRVIEIDPGQVETVRPRLKAERQMPAGSFSNPNLGILRRPLLW